MKTISIIACLLFASGAFAADCVTNNGKTVCSNGQSAAAVNRNTGTVTTARKKYIKWRDHYCQNSNGSRAAYNPHTGNAAVSQAGQRRSEDHPDQAWRHCNDQKRQGRRHRTQWHHLRDRTQSSAAPSNGGTYRRLDVLRRRVIPLPALAPPGINRSPNGR